MDRRFYSDREPRDRERYPTKGDDPPNSRLFIIGHKQLSEDDFRGAFSKFGKIEEIWVVRDKRSGENKGVTYIKYSKTSEAAHALEEMNGTVIGDAGRAIKIVIAASRDQGSKREQNEGEKGQRLFVLVSKITTIAELEEHFKQFGDVEYANIIKDKETRESKGYAYVKYYKFTHAAKAFESCDRKYKAVFAEPRRAAGTPASGGGGGGSAGNNHSGYGMYGGGGGGGGGGGNYDSGRYMRNDYPTSGGRDHHDMSMGPGGYPSMREMAQEYGPTRLRVIASSMVNEDQLWKLFDIVPGLDYCQLRAEPNSGRGVATVVYCSPEKAAYACEKLHGFEYPPGFRLIVKPDEQQGGMEGVVVGGGGGGGRRSGGSGGGGGGSGNGGDPNLRHLAETIAHATSLIKSANYTGGGSNMTDSSDICNVQLPDRQPLADVDAELAGRCFIVCTPPPPPLPILKDIFCRFGDLIEVYMLSNRNCGYARYASKGAVDAAIRTLHGAEICGGRMKVMEAEERDDPQRKRQKLHEN